MGDTNILEVVLHATDNASRTIENLGNTIDETGQKTQNLSKAFGIAGGIITGIGVGGVVMMKSWVDSAAAAQVQMASVDQILQNAADSMRTTTVAVGGNSTELKNNKKAIDDQVKSISLQIQQLKLSTGDHKDQIKALQDQKNALQLSGIAIEQTAVTHGHLTTQVNKNAESYDQLKATTEGLMKTYAQLGFDHEDTATAFAKDINVTHDVKTSQEMLSVSADLARYKQIDLGTATQAVTLAYEGNTKILKQLGIEVDKGATKQQVLGEISDKVKGQAQAFADTYEGQISVVKLQTDELGKSLGEVLLPMVQNVLTKVLAFVNKLNEMDPKKFEVIAKSVLAITAIALVIGPLLLLVAALPAIAAGFSLLMGPLGLILLIAAAIGVAAFEIIMHWTAVKKFFETLWANIVSVFKSAVAWVGNELKNLENWFTQTWANTKASFDGFVVSVGNFITSVLTWFAELPLNIALYLYDLYFVKIPFAIGYIWGYLSVEVPKIIKGVITWFEALPGNIEKIFLNVVNAIVQKIVDTWNYLSVEVPKIVNDIGAWLASLPAAVGAIFTAAYQWVVNEITAAWTWLSTEVPTWPGKIVAFIASIPGDVEKIFSGVKDGAVNQMTQLWQGVKDIWDKVKQIFSDIKQAADDAWNAATKAFNAGTSAGVKGSRAVGGWINETGLYQMHAGEYVLSNGMLKGTQPAAVSTTNNHNTPITINAYVQDISNIDQLGQRLAFQLANSGRI